MRKKKKEAEHCDKKRKGVLGEIDEQKKKQQQQLLYRDVDGLTTSADELGENTEKSRSVTCVVKSNSLRHLVNDNIYRHIYRNYNSCGRPIYSSLMLNCNVSTHMQQ
jgi:hypothetical protein